MYDLDKYDNKAIQIRSDVSNIKDYILDGLTIRQCAKELMMSKTKVHTYIHTYIRVYYPEEYSEIKVKLKYNQKHKCMPRKYWR